MCKKNSIYELEEEIKQASITENKKIAKTRRVHCLCKDKMPGGRQKTSGKSHNKSSETFDCQMRPSINIYCPSCYWNVLNYQIFQKTCREKC